MLKFLSFVLMCVVLCAGWARAEDGPPVPKNDQMMVTVDLQMSMFSRVLRYEENLKRRLAGDSLVVGIIYQGESAQSILVKEEVTAAIIDLAQIGDYTKVGTVPLRVSSATDLVREIDRHGIHIIYVAPLLEAKKDVVEIARATRSRKVLTLTGIPDYLKQGLAVSIETTSSHRPMVIFNLPVVDAEGCAFQAHLLQKATIVNQTVAHPLPADCEAVARIYRYDRH